MTAPYLGSTGVVRTPRRIICFKVSCAARFMATSVPYAWRSIRFVRPTTSGCLVRARPACVRLPALKGTSDLRKSAACCNMIRHPPVETSPPGRGYTRTPHRLPGFVYGTRYGSPYPRVIRPRTRRTARCGSSSTAQPPDKSITLLPSQEATGCLREGRNTVSSATTHST